ncbi:MAG: DNA polymerase III subunit chi [Alphaproteobacteria bacterium]
MKIQFYQVQGTTPAEADAVLPSLLERILATGAKAVVRCPTVERMERVSQLLWSYNPTSFLAHGCAGDAHESAHPVWLTPEQYNPNAATFLLSLGGVLGTVPLPEETGSYERVLDIFDASDAQVHTARARWKHWKNQGHEMAYYALAEGRWQQKA